ncbi:MAG: efflux RND transporter periplasmic adaptor subunit, partial [Polyangiaceae bacterium]|nr:efflux RND transporter periplasmic adaptor subunit [Polyangiaceae bacterium]
MKSGWKQFIAVIVVLLGGVGGAWGLVLAKDEVKTERAVPPLPLVRAVMATRTPVQLNVNLNGVVRPTTTLTLTAEVSGRITVLSPNLDEGAFVNANETLVTIDSRDYDIAVAQANARVTQAEFKLKLEETEAKIAKDDWEKYGTGKPDPMVLREPHLLAAKAEVASAQSALAKAMLDLSRCSVNAPFAGRVQTKHVEAGQFVRAGEPLAVIYAIDGVEIDVAVPNDQLAYLDLGLGATPGKTTEASIVATIAGERATWQGRIVRTGAEIDARTRSVNVTIRVDKPYGSQSPLLPGAFVSVEITGKRVEGIFEIPAIAMRDADTLLIVDKDSRMHRRDVDVLRLTATTAL